EDGKLTVKHISVTDIAELPRLQGSKYVQSSIGFAYKEVKQYLLQGRKVLFSGTPCQIDALKGFLNKDYDNLILIDIICHGVPSQKMFNEYVDLLEDKTKMTIDELNFRDKKKGWDNFYLNITNSNKNKDIFWELSSYYKFFVKGYIYRENCYSCKYATRKRISDITIGDYWGIRQQHPELFNDDKWFEYSYDGISCVMVNNEKG
ncbi:MAG TPA: coenzyme F420 hydrogenase, partial [Ruminococcaceae bacterium]|nr:coenzyme F420 hydrogenase [Oscillospiraceae bacterium]